MDLLKEKRLDDNTLVIFSSDNGPHAEGKVDPEFFDSNKPFRGIKRDLYDGGIRIPMVAWWPGKIEAGITSAHRSALWDFLPTCAELADVEVNDEVNGISYLPMLLGNTEAQRKHDLLYWEFSEQGKKQAVLVGKWKLVYLLKDNRYELYHLPQDVDENENLMEQQSEIFQELKEKMEKARTVSEEFPF